MAERTRAQRERSPAPSPAPAPRAGAATTVTTAAAAPVPHHAVARLARSAAGTPPGRGASPRARLLMARAQPRLRVSRPGDPAEREAEAVATSVARGTSTAPSVGRSPAPAGPETDVGGGPAPAAVEALVASPPTGEPLAAEIRAAVEPVLGADLRAVRVHTDERSAAAASAIAARAFTVGQDVFLGPGESPRDHRLLAHELTHVVQQNPPTAERSTNPARGPPAYAVMRAVDGADGMLGHEASDIAQGIPGYTLLCQVVGEDLITGDAVRADDGSILEDLLTYGPFAGAFAPVLRTLDVLSDIVTLVMGRLAEHDLTLARLVRDMSDAWDEMDLLEGISYNVRIAERYIDAFVDDVRAFVGALVDDVLEAVRAAAVTLVKPLLERPEVAPYWSLATKVFGHDPLTGEDVQAPTVEILADFLRLIGQEDALAQMQERGTLQSTADWLDTQLATFADLATRTGQLISDAWDAISPSNLLELPTTLPDLADRAVTLVREVGAFATEVVTTVLALVKDSLLGWLSSHAHDMWGFPLLTVVLGRDPFTGEPVDRSAENLIRAFILLLPGGEATYEQLAQSGVVGEAAARIEAALGALDVTWDGMVALFHEVWDQMSLADLLAPVAAFERVLAQVSAPVGRIIAFVGEVVRVVVNLVLAVMGFPTELLGHIVDEASAAIDDIGEDPLGFLGNLVDAMKAGFSAFFEHVGEHLLGGLVDWLFRGLRGLGIEPPTSLTLESAITLVVQVLGISVDALWERLATKLDPEKVDMMRGAIDRLGEAWAFVTDVSERGVSAIWEFVQGQLSNLWDLIVTTARDWIVREIVEKVTAKLISMLDPTGIMAIINGTIAFFKAVQSAIEYLTDMLRIVDGWVSTIASIARGAITPGAQRLEQGLADAVPVAIGFLANQVGLGNVSEMVSGLLLGLREKFWLAVDWVIDQALRLGQAALGALGLGGESEASTTDDPETDVAEEGVLGLALDHLSAALGDGATFEEAQEAVTHVLSTLSAQGLHGLDLVQEPSSDDVQVMGAASPSRVIGRLISFSRRPQVRIVATVRYVEAPPEVAGTLPPSPGRTGRGSVELFDREGTGTRERGGAVLPDARGAPANSIRLATWNTSDYVDDRDAPGTHAEQQLAGWFERNEHHWPFIRGVHVDLQGYSPCTDCGRALEGITRSLNSRPQGGGDPSTVSGAPVDATLSWTGRVFTSRRYPYTGTTNQTLSELVAAGWTVSPATLPGELLTDLDLMRLGHAQGVAGGIRRPSGSGLTAA